MPGRRGASWIVGGSLARFRGPGRVGAFENTGSCDCDGPFTSPSLVGSIAWVCGTPATNETGRSFSPGVVGITGDTITNLGNIIHVDGTKIHWCGPPA